MAFVNFLPMEAPSGKGKELKSKWGTALSKSPFIVPKSGLGEEGIKLDPELISTLLETLGIMDPGGGFGLTQPLAFSLFPKTAQWGKAATRAAERANEALMRKSATLKQFSETPLFLQPRGYLGKETVAQAKEGAVHLPFQYGFDEPQMRWAGKVITTPEEYIESILGHEAIHLAGQKGGSTIKAIESAAAERPDLFRLFGGSEAYKNPATWAPEYVARVGQQVAVPRLPVSRLTHPVDVEWLELMSSYLKNPKLTLKEMEQMAPSLAKSFTSPSYYTPSYTGAGQFAGSKEKATQMSSLFKTIKDDVAWGAETHPIRGTAELVQSPFVRQRFQNEIINRLKGLMDDPLVGASKKDAITDVKRLIEYAAKLDVKDPRSAANLELVAQSLHGMYHRRAGTVMAEARKILGNDENADRIIRGLVFKAQTTPYPGAGKYSIEEIKELRRGEVEKWIPQKGTGSKKGRGLTEAPAPKSPKEDIGNMVKVFLDDGNVAYFDRTNPDLLADIAKLNKK